MKTYGRLDQAQRVALAALVQGRRVHDLGSGTGVLAKEIADLGASHVVAVDSAHHFFSFPHERITWRNQDFWDVKDEIDVAFVSWPSNDVDAAILLASLGRRSRTVVYLGKNTDGTACGAKPFFSMLLRRRLVIDLPSRYNCLVAVDEPLSGPPRAPTSDEYAALCRDDAWITYEAANLTVRDES